MKPGRDSNTLKPHRHVIAAKNGKLKRKSNALPVAGKPDTRPVSNLKYRAPLLPSKKTNPNLPLWTPAFAGVTNGWKSLPKNSVIPAKAGIQSALPQPQPQTPSPQLHGLPPARE